MSFSCVVESQVRQRERGLLTTSPYCSVILCHEGWSISTKKSYKNSLFEVRNECLWKNLLLQGVIENCEAGIHTEHPKPKGDSECPLAFPSLPSSVSLSAFPCREIGLCNSFLFKYTPRVFNLFKKLYMLFHIVLTINSKRHFTDETQGERVYFSCLFCYSAFIISCEDPIDSERFFTDVWLCLFEVDSQ